MISDDARTIAAALDNVAEAIREFARSFVVNEDGEPQEPTTYMDGKPIR